MRLCNLTKVLLCLVMVSVLICAGWFAHELYYYDSHNTIRLVKAGKKYRYTSPLLDVELPEGVSVRHEPNPFKYKVKLLVEKLIKNGRARQIAVYYRDLNDGPWFGINEKVEFDAESIMKVPVMIAWLKKAENNPALLQQVFAFDSSRNLSAIQSIRPAATLAPGMAYTVNELLRYMLNFSDNNATSILYENLKPNEIDDVLNNMDVTNHPRDDHNYISLHGYSGFFRILYNAAYLNREMSEKALNLLTLQDFPYGIAAGVPSGVPVAAKFGEHVRGLNGEDKQLCDFGIVYHPNGPYLLGVMTQGDDFGRLAEIISSISALVYAEASSGVSGGKQELVPIR